MGNEGTTLKRFVTLDECGLLSKANKELIKFIYGNKIVMVNEFISMMDDSSFSSHIPHTDTLIEARGLADLLKLRYYDEPLMVDSYLSSLIVDASYFIYEEEHKMLSVKDSKGKNVNVYTAITRLGFNDKERQIILDRSYSAIEGRLFIDLLLEVYYELIAKEKHTDFENVFINKLTLIINYYKKKNNVEDVSSVDYLINSKIQKLSSLMVQRDNIDRKIDALKQSILELKSNGRCK